MERIVVAGASLAGATAAAKLRDEGFDGEILLVGEEAEPPYERPPLSKEYLRGEQPFEKSLVRPPEFWSEHSVECRYGVRVERVLPAEHAVELDDGERVRYSKLLVATGGRNRRLDVPGADLEGVLDLRTVRDSDRIREEAARGRKAVVVGMGFIGAELAASLRRLGLEVTVVEVFRTALFRILGEEVGRAMERIHRDHGVEMLFEDTVSAFEGGARVERVVTERGRRIDCDFAVVGIGIQPNVELLEGTGAQLENGVVVDELCRTSLEDVYAAGDVANHEHPVFGRVRVEHWQNALLQGEAAALSMLGRGNPYDEVHWFWSDQYDHTLNYAGFHTEYDELVVRGSLEEPPFAAFYVTDGRVRAAVAIDRGREVRRAIPVIRSGARVDPAVLRDSEADLRKLVS